VDLKLSPDGVLVDLEYPTVAVVGYSGRDRAAVQVHLDELAAHGVPPPAEVPAVWELDASALTSAGRIEVDPARSSGEVEPVLARAGGDWYLSVGSDHTDRVLERTSMAAAKSACPKVIASECWRLADVEARWDTLELRSQVRVCGAWRDYQRGPLALIRQVGFYRRRFADVVGDLVVFCGTVPTIDGLVLGADVFRAALVDPGLGRTLTCQYQLAPPTLPGSDSN